MLNADEFLIILSKVSCLDRLQRQALSMKLTEAEAQDAKGDALKEEPEIYAAVSGISKSLTSLRKKQLEDARTKVDSLLQVNGALEALSLTDTLTGLANRRAFDQNLITLCRGEDNRQLALAMIDVDCFKLYNDHFGHPAGDACLRQVANALQSVSRGTGMIAYRYGGEEFALIMPDVSIASAVEHANLAGKIHGVRSCFIPAAG